MTPSSNVHAACISFEYPNFLKCTLQSRETQREGTRAPRSSGWGCRQRFPGVDPMLHSRSHILMAPNSIPCYRSQGLPQVLTPGLPCKDPPWRILSGLIPITGPWKSLVLFFDHCPPGPQTAVFLGCDSQLPDSLYGTKSVFSVMVVTKVGTTTSWQGHRTCNLGYLEPSQQ